MMVLNRRQYRAYGIASVSPFEQKQGEIFLKGMFYRCTEGWVEIRPLRSGRREWIELGTFRHNALPDGNDICVGVATREHGKGTKNDILQIPALWVDLDFKQTPKQEADRQIGGFKLKPSIIVESGGGYHMYWLLDKPALKHETGRVEKINRCLALHLGGDIGSVDASRILRLPGTLNSEAPRGKPRGIFSAA